MGDIAHSTGAGQTNPMNWASPLSDTILNPAVGQGREPSIVDFFGLPNYDMGLRADDYAKTQTHILKHAYAGKNIVIADTIRGYIVDTDDWFTRNILPFQRTDELTVQFTEVVFDRTVIDRVPSLGVTRRLELGQNKRFGGLSRRGIQFILEHEFWKTEMGRRDYRLNIMNIRTAVLLTIYYTVLKTLLSGKDRYIKWRRHFRGHKYNMSEVLRWTKERWGIVQKSREGLYTLHADYLELMSYEGKTPNAWIWPKRVAMYLSLLNKEAIDYSKAGPVAQQNLELGPKRFATFGGLTVYEANTVELAEFREPVNMLARDRIIGDFFILSEFNPGTDYASGRYRSSWRSTMVYSMKADNFVPVSLLDCLENCKRFDANGDLSKDHDTLANEIMTIEQDLRMRDRDGHIDLFVNRTKDGKGEKAQLWGHLNPSYLTFKDLADLGASVSVRLGTENIDSDVNELITNVIEVKNGLANAYRESLRRNSRYTSLFNEALLANDVLPDPVAGAPTAWPPVQPSADSIAALAARARDLDAWDAANVAKIVAVNDSFTGARVTVTDKIAKFYPDMSSAQIGEALKGLASREIQVVATGTGSRRGGGGAGSGEGGAFATARFGRLAEDPYPPASMKTTLDALKSEVYPDAVFRLLSPETKNALDGFKVGGERNQQRTRWFLKKYKEGNFSEGFAKIQKTPTKEFWRYFGSYLENIVAKADTFIDAADAKDKDRVNQAKAELIEWAVQSTLKPMASFEEYNMPAEVAVVAKRGVKEYTQGEKRATERAGRGYARAKLGGDDDDNDNDDAMDVDTTRSLHSAGEIVEMALHPADFLDDNLWAQYRPVNPETGQAVQSKSELKKVAALYNDNHPMTYGVVRQTFAEGKHEGRRFAASQQNKKRNAPTGAYGSAKRSRVDGGGDSMSMTAQARLSSFSSYRDTTLEAMKYPVDGGNSKNLAINLQKAAQIADPQHKLAAILFLLSNITKQYLLKTIENHTLHPVDYLCIRPTRVYTMGSGILCRGGRELGVTYYGHEDFQFDNNIHQKFWTGNFTFWFNCFIIDAGNYIIAEDIIGLGYKGGEHVAFYTNKEQFRPEIQRYKADIFCVMCPRGSLNGAAEGRSGPQLQREINVHGRWSQEMYGDEIEAEADFDWKQVLYPGAQFMNVVWKFQRLTMGMVHNGEKYNFEGARKQQLAACFQTAQRFVNQATGEYTNEWLNDGFWGEIVEKGVRAARTGAKAFIERRHTFQ